MSEPNALLNVIPHVRTAVRKPSSPRVYHFERRKTAPYHPMRTYTKHPPWRLTGKNALSQIPKKKRVRRAPVKL